MPADYWRALARSAAAVVVIAAVVVVVVVDRYVERADVRMRWVQQFAMLADVSSVGT